MLEVCTVLACPCLARFPDYFSIRHVDFSRIKQRRFLIADLNFVDSLYFSVQLVVTTGKSVDLTHSLALIVQAIGKTLQ